MVSQIKIEKDTSPKQKPNQDTLGFGQYFTDHMFVMDYSEDKGWYDPRIVPYGPLPLDPSTMVYHYGQSIFEGLKAYKTLDHNILLFRPDKNVARINVSNERLCIPKIDTNIAIDAIKALVDIDREWIPSEDDTSLYIRPFIIATDPYLGIRPSSTYKFIIILSPVGAYYSEGVNPIKIYVETNYARAVKGGTGFAKTSANYASSLKAQVEAKEKGYAQVLWLDAIEKKYIEEVGSMNVFFRFKNEVVTPALNGSILAGITRDSTICILKSMGINVVERRITIEEVYDSYKKGDFVEAFGTGTAAVISPIGELNWNDNKIVLNNGKIGEMSQNIYNTITGIQNGSIEDKFNWMVKI
jgi:branched-chain amino acid aminotransferase